MAVLFKEALYSSDFVVTAEIDPVKGTDIEKMLNNIDLLKDRVDALSVTDNKSSIMRISPLSVCYLIRERGGEPILSLTCRDRNRLALQSDLLSAYILGVRNVLCLTGDDIAVGDDPQARAVFDLDSVRLIQAVRSLEGGRDLGGNKLDGAVGFCVGAVVVPEAVPFEPEAVKFEQKVEAGAEFFLTQAVYNLDSFQRFMDYARRFQVKILAGIIPLFSAGMARFMNANVPGISIPRDLIEELARETTGKPMQVGVKKGVEIAGRIIKTLKREAICDGVHIMTIGREHLVPEILEAAEL